MPPQHVGSLGSLLSTAVDKEINLLMKKTKLLGQFKILVF